MIDWMICYLIFAVGYCWGSFVTYKIMKLKQKGTREIMDYALGFLAGMYFTILCIWTQLIVRENKRKAQEK